ncbi:MAG: PucR family transcriptional regulator [Aminivibrio sp.]|jgi:sugar diacid utilization regulator
MHKVTVRQLLQSSVFNKYMTLVGGEEGLDRTVEYITVWESPDMWRWLNGNEFIISAGYTMRYAPDRGLADYDKMTDIISAIGFKISNVIDGIPQQFIDIANRKKIPIFLIKRDGLFRFIIQTVSAEINQADMSFYLDVGRFFKDLSHIALNDSRDTALLSSLSKWTSNPCAAVSEDLETITVSSFNNPGWDWKIRAEELKTCMKAAAPLKEDFVLGPWRIWPCFANGICLGYLAVYCEDDLTNRKILMIKQLSTVLSMKWFERHNAHQESLLQMWSRLLNEPRAQNNEFIEILSKKGISVEKGVQTVIIGSQNGRGKNTDPTAMLSLASRLRYVMPNHLQIEKSPHELVLILSSHGQEKMDNTAWLSVVEKIISQNAGYVMAIGPTVNKVYDVPESYKIAGNCLALWQDAPGSPILRYDEMLAELAMIDGVGSMSASLLIDRVLGEFNETGPLNSLYETAVTISKMNDINEAALQLHVHPNTIRYRLRRIMEITGMNLSSPRDCRIFSQAVFFKEMRDVLRKS